jgi:hypothetical protein
VVVGGEVPNQLTKKVGGWVYEPVLSFNVVLEKGVAQPAPAGAGGVLSETVCKGLCCVHYSELALEVDAVLRGQCVVRRLGSAEDVALAWSAQRVGLDVDHTRDVDSDEVDVPRRCQS